MNGTPSVIYLSPIGVQLFEERLAQQRKVHAQICQDREIAHELSGDGWHDNPDFNRLQQLEANSTWKLKELEHVLTFAQRYSAEEGARPTERVQVGSVVKVLMYDAETDEARERIFEVVGYQESDPKQACISYNAPLAKCLLGLRPGEITSAQIGHEELELEVVSLFRSRQEGGLPERVSPESP